MANAEERDEPISGLVLAGGRGRRMGRDKALLELNGERLVDRAALALASFCAEVVVASGDGVRLRPLEWPQIADIEANAGPLAGIIAGLERARSPLVAVVAVDMPFANPAVFRLLARNLKAGRELPAAMPVVDGSAQPLHALYARSAARSLRAVFDAGERSPTAALARLGALQVRREAWRAADHDGTFALGLNRPEDFARLR